MVDDEKMNEMDRHWKEVMDLAQQYGFIGYAYGGTAILLTHKNQLKEDGAEKYLFRQRSMFGINMGKDDESDSKVSGK